MLFQSKIEFDIWLDTHVGDQKVRFQYAKWLWINHESKDDLVLAAGMEWETANNKHPMDATKYPVKFDLNAGWLWVNESYVDTPGGYMGPVGGGESGKLWKPKNPMRSVISDELHKIVYPYRQDLRWVFPTRKEAEIALANALMKNNEMYHLCLLASC